MFDDTAPTSTSLPDPLHPWYQPPLADTVAQASQRIMAIHAHPDDEASKGAGTIARYTDQGVRATLVTCTGGEAGEILNPAARRADTDAPLPTRRLIELAESAQICCYSDVYLLGYRDSGMAGSPENANPDAFANVDFDEAVWRLVYIIRLERPQVLLAYDQHEQYPHPDHIMAHKIAMAAYTKAADPNFCDPRTVTIASERRELSLDLPWQVQKLYWFHWSWDRIKDVDAEFDRRGWESPFTEWIKHIDAQSTEEPDMAPTTLVDVREYIPAMRAALLAHETQIPSDWFWLRLPDETLKTLMPYEEFTLVEDNTARDQRPIPETNLFAGVI